MLYSSISQSEFLSFIFKGWAVKQHNHREQNDPATTQQLELFGRNNPVTWRAVCAVTAPDLIKCFLLVFGSWHCNSTTLSIKLCLISNIGIRQLLFIGITFIVLSTKESSLILQSVPPCSGPLRHGMQYLSGFKAKNKIIVDLQFIIYSHRTTTQILHLNITINNRL